MITPQKLQVLTSMQLAEKWATPLNQAMDEFAINTPARQNMFLAQVAHESAGFAITQENLLYTHVDRIRAVFSKRVADLTDDEIAGRLLGNPKALANHVYCNRMGNGDEASGDGWAYHGRGLIQLTGYTNYKAACEFFGLDLIADPEIAMWDEVAARIAAWFFSRAGCNDLADAGEFEQITKRINGGLNVQPDRVRLLKLISDVAA